MTAILRPGLPKKVPLAEAMRVRGYLPAAEAASRAHCELSTVHRWADDGEVVYTRVGKRLFVEVNSLAKKLGPVLAAAEGLVKAPAPATAPAAKTAAE